MYFLFLLFLIVFVTRAVNGLLVSRKDHNTLCEDIEVVDRGQWLARDPKTPVTKIDTPLSYVVIHHSEFEACTDLESCSLAARIIQDFHMDFRGWDDVGYNFLIGEDGRVYTGRGWQGVGAHAYGWNTLSYGICMIGTYFSHQPTHVALTAANNLIECGIKRGYIAANYKLYGHKDVGVGKTCPGGYFYDNWIKTHPHF